MKRVSFFTIVTFLSICSCDNGNDDDGAVCDYLYGTYIGEFEGESPFRGDLYITISESTPVSASIQGTWNGENGYYGSITRTRLECEAGKVDCSYGFYLEGPSSVLCPPDECSSYSGPPCYCGGAPLGSFEGSFTESTGNGVFKVDSTQAEDMGLSSGGGTWIVQRD